MTRVKVSSFFTMKDILGDGQITLKPEESTVQGLLQALSRKHGEKFNRQIFDKETGDIKFYRIVVNGRPDPGDEDIGFRAPFENVQFGTVTFTGCI